MSFRNTMSFQGRTCNESQWREDEIVEIERMKLRAITDVICKQARYPLVALRLLIHVVTEIDTEGNILISARQLSKAMGVHYDTVSKSLRYLREIEVLRIER